MGGSRARVVARVTAAVVAIAAVAWAFVAYRVIGHPGLDRPTAADAVVVLGPAQVGDVLTLGEELVDRGLARSLVVSTVPGRRGQLGRLCRDRPADLPAGATLTCFVPDPTTTQGEARSVGELALRNHWHTVIVVTPTYHAARARLLLGRCFTGRLELVAPPDHASTTRWMFETLYQTGGFLKAAITPGC